MGGGYRPPARPSGVSGEVGIYLFYPMLVVADHIHLRFHHECGMDQEEFFNTTVSNACLLPHHNPTEVFLSQFVNELYGDC
jgi:hypothetical protein